MYLEQLRDVRFPTSSPWYYKNFTFMGTFFWHYRQNWLDSDLLPLYITFWEAL